MRALKTWWLLLLGLLGLPYVFVFVAGTVWLYQQHVLWYWIGASAVVTLGCVGVARWLQNKSLQPIRARVEPNVNWSPSGEAAWQQVERIAERAKSQPMRFDDLQAWTARLLDLLREVLETVARGYRADSDHAVLEIPLPHVLQIVELAARDLRRQMVRNIPLSHVLTLNDFRRLPKLGVLTRRLYAIYRVVRFGVNPLAAIPREVVDAVATQYQETTFDEAVRWALGYYVETVGFYAIQLYSGQLVAEDDDFNRYQTSHSTADLAEAGRRAEVDRGEPLRMLVLGQVKAGKSSLLNALFGQTKAATDVVPRTRFVEPYAIEIEGVRRAVILDTAGYEEARQSGEPIAALRRQILQSDLVLLVVSAVSAAREADRKLLAATGSLFQQDADRTMPPVVVVVSHIDQLRPLGEWDPPYDVASPSIAKAKNIRAALDQVATDLEVEPERVIPVCLKPERIYNVDQALLPTILHVLPEAERAKCLRCLPQFRRARNWSLLWEQAVSSGRLIFGLGAARLANMARRGSVDRDKADE